jgi:hypothetical protein
LLTYLLDTGCLIAAQTPGERYYEATDQLVEAGREGRVHLLTATSVEYDLEKASPELGDVRRDWLSERPYIRRVPGPFTLDVSRLDWGDVLVSDEQAELLSHLKRILGTPAPSEQPGDGWRRRQIDRHHASAALLAEADALVTTDGDDLLSKRDAVWSACGLRILDPDSALVQLDPEGD